MHPLVTAYLAQLYAIQQTGAAQPEQSYYGPLQNFLRAAAESLHHGGTQVILQPQHQDYGVPDFQVQQDHTIIGWVEAKSLGGALNHNTKQLREYRSALHNLLFTNFLRFRLFIRGEQHGPEVVLADAANGPIHPHAIAALGELLNAFLQESVPAVQSAAQLADILALRARFLRHAVVDAMGLGPVQALRNAYKQYLFPTIDDDVFADLVAQTIVYTLFASWSQTPAHGFTLANAAAHLPPNPALLRTLFTLTVSNAALVGTPIGLHVSAVANLLAATDPNILLAGADEDVQADVGHDPVMYFYQPFLHAYSPKTAKSRGVYYTPIPAVKAMVRLANAITVERYERALGLAGPNVFVLDPATGTGTFLVQVANQIVNNVTDAGDAEMMHNYLHDRFIANTFGFEFLAAPYTIAHLKLARFLHHEMGMQNVERLKVYLTNTLHTPQFAAPALPLLENLAEENQAATAIKTVQPLLIVIGNPPWSGHSENLNVQLNAMDAVEPFKWCDGERVAQTKWINNDYVKFLRWSQWRITENEHVQLENPDGIIVLITDNSYLSSPSFRGVRRHFLTQFDQIYLINLHGNIRTGAAGVPDQNIFDVQQGVCIGVFIRGGVQGNPDQIEQPPVEPIEHAVENESPFLTFALPAVEEQVQPDNVALQELSTAAIRASIRYISSGPGTKNGKYAWLNELNWQTVKTSQRLQPEPPFYFFTPFQTDAEYFAWPSIDECLPFNSMCVTTGDDAARVFITQAEIQSSAPAGANIRPYLYRAFDTRWINHDAAQLARSRHEVMAHFYRPNVGILALRQTRREGRYDYAFVTTTVTDKSCLSTEANSSVFPLYRYLTPEMQGALPGNMQPQRVPNIREELLAELSNAYGADHVTPERVFYYIYAILNADGYLTQYEEQLPKEFPHIPFPRTRQPFEQLAALGRTLADAHLGVGLVNANFPFSSTGDNTIAAASLHYDPVQQTIRVNNTGTHFAGIGPEMWDYKVGINQPLTDWLASRGGRTLVLDYTEDAPEQALIDDFRGIARRIATARPVHQNINAVWTAMIQD